MIAGAILPARAEEVEHAKEEDICILVSKEATFTVCGKLYELIK